MSSDATISALKSFFPFLIPEMVLGGSACVLFLGATFRARRAYPVWGTFTLIALVVAGFLVGYSLVSGPDINGIRSELGAGLKAAKELKGDERTQKIKELREKAQSLLEAPLSTPTVEAANAYVVEMRKLNEGGSDDSALKSQVAELRAQAYVAPILPSQFALLIKILALVGTAVLVLFSWSEMPTAYAAEYHGCLLLIAAGMGVIGSANDLVTLFLALELVSIPTYILLYLVRQDSLAQEAAMKYFLLSVFSSALLLFGFSYLYGLTGTTNVTGMVEALSNGMDQTVATMAIVAMVMVVAGLGFRITAVPFHFYAPDVYQGTATGAAALLAFVPKVAGFAALLRVMGLLYPVLPPLNLSDQTLVVQPVLERYLPSMLWMLAAITMTLGNVLALLQDNVKRMLAYSSVAHAGYMLIGLAVAPKLAGDTSTPLGGAEAVIFYLFAYGGMTIGAFAILHYLSQSASRQGGAGGDVTVETMDDLTGLGRTHPGLALLMVLFLFSLIGIPLTAGFNGKLFLLLGALGLPTEASAGQVEQLRSQAQFFRVLALIAMLNAAIGGWYYLRIAALMFLRDPIRTLPHARPWPVLTAILLCALFTVGLGVYPAPLVNAIRNAVPQQPTAETRTATLPKDGHIFHQK